jgi:DNA polymerase III delta prime subunit
MRAIALLCLAAVPACTAWSQDDDWPEAETFDRGRIAPTPSTAPASGCADLVPKATYAIETDLAIDVERKDRGAIEPGQWLEMRARIRNAGSSDRKVVLSSDGSEVGWREPHVWWTAYVQAPGSECAIEVPPQVVSRCGMFDHDWHDEVIELDAGDARDLEWLGNPSYSLDLASMPEGTVTLFLHYAYTAGKVGKSSASEAVDLGPMAGEAAFEVVSNPIVMELERPLALELAPRGDRSGSPSNVGDLFTLAVRNDGDDTKSIAHADASRLRFEVVGKEESFPQGQWRDGVEPAGKTLGAGKSMKLALDDFAWVPPEAEKVRVRASFRPYAEEGKASVEIKSAWVEIDLSK